MSYFLAGVLRPFFWLIVLSISLWAVRKCFPRAEKYLFGPAFPTIGLAVRRLVRAIRRRHPPA